MLLGSLTWNLLCVKGSDWTNTLTPSTAVLNVTDLWFSGALVTREANLSSKGRRSRSLGTRMKSVFTHMFVKNGSIYVKPRSKWSATHSTHIIEYVSPVEMLSFVIFVCLSVYHIAFVHSVLEHGWTFIFFGKVTPHASEWWCNCKIKRSKVKDIGNANVNIVFRAYHCEAQWCSG